MDKKKDDRLVDALKDAVREDFKGKGGEPQYLIEILYEYLSEHISTHFEKTVEGIDTLHASLIARQKEHEGIISRLAGLEEKMKRIEALLEKK